MAVLLLQTKGNLLVLHGVYLAGHPRVPEPDFLQSAAHRHLSAVPVTQENTSEHLDTQKANFLDAGPILDPHLLLRAPLLLLLLP